MLMVQYFIEKGNDIYPLFIQSSFEINHHTIDTKYTIKARSTLGVHSPAYS